LLITHSAGPSSAYPKPNVGAVLVAEDGTILGQGKSNYRFDAVRATLMDAGVEMTPLVDQWCITWLSTTSALRNLLMSSTLYVTLEPSATRYGTAHPPATSLLEATGIRRVVVGCPDPVPERSTQGVTALHQAGVLVTMGIMAEECHDLIRDYAITANSKLQRMARQHFRQFHRPLGFLHCSVVASENVEAFARNANAFGTNFGGHNLSFRDFGSYEIAPPPEVIWADNQKNNNVAGARDVANSLFDESRILEVDFDDEFSSPFSLPSGNPMMPWYSQVDAVVGTFPRSGNGPVGDNSVKARLNGLKWLATHGQSLPAGVERVLVMDATDLVDLPLSNDDPNLPYGVNVESFWRGKDRKATRVLLRRGVNAQARAAADAAAKAAQTAADAAQMARGAIESGDATDAAEAALGAQKAAILAIELIQQELEVFQSKKQKLSDLGVLVETIAGGEPIDVMTYLGERHGLRSVVWRAGCWGDRGVRAILAGAFQWISAHLAVDAYGGRFWQLMLAENAIQGACGPERKVKVFADQDDISLEYCDQADEDTDCTLSINGKPVRHIRLDCRVALVDESRPREFVLAKTKKIDQKYIEEAAPWFL
jgi:pyrimidine deaminase RibD-like protein